MTKEENIILIDATRLAEIAWKQGFEAGEEKVWRQQDGNFGSPPVMGFNFDLIMQEYKRGV